jgi:hypothetical protein
MADIIEFDPNPYMRPPRLDVRQGVALAIALLSALPGAAPDGVKRAGRRLRKATVALQKAWSKRERAAIAVKPAEKAKVDNRVDIAWGGLKMRLDATAALPVETYPEASRAQEIVGTLFPNGLGFLTLPMDAEWSVSDELVTRIEEDGLAADINALAGPEYLAEVKAAHLVYGEVLGITKAKAPPAETTALSEPLRDVGRAISDYTLQVLATADRERPDTIESARAALHPLDRYREGAARRAGGKSDKGEGDGSDVSVDTPVPEVPQ